MKLVNTSVKRPVGVIMIVAAVIALGFVSLKGLVIDLFPQIDLPIAVVATGYPDAAPEDVENSISRPIEAAVSSVEGIDMVQAQSQTGSSLVLMMFKNGVDLDQALLDVRERVDQVKGFLPAQAREPSIIRFSPDQLPIMWVSLTGKDAATLTDLADSEIVPYFERQEGVASVTVEGGQEREIQLILDQSKLTQYGVAPQMVMQAINSSNQSASVGQIEKGTQNLQLRVSGEFNSLDDIKQTIVQTATGATVHLEDVAEVRDTFKASRALTLVDGEPALVLSIMKKTDGNTVDVATNIKDSIAALQPELGSDVKLDVVIDTSDFVQMSVDSVVLNILIGGAISIFILLLFLRSVRATLVIGVSIPIAVISTFSLMYFTGQSLNILTLGGLALGLGMMVDSSIVILENIYSYRSKGYSLFESATKGASELAPAVIASTTTTLVVFLPIVYVEGIASDLFTPLALTVAFSLIASLIVSITLIPMLSSKLLSQAMEEKGTTYWFDRFLEKLRNLYQVILEKVLTFRKSTVFATLLLIAISIAVTPLIGAEFIPASDQGQVTITVKTTPGSALKHTEAIAQQVTEKLAPYEQEIATNYLSIGGGGFGGGAIAADTATFTMQLKQTKDRERSTDEIVEAMRADLSDVPSAEIVVGAMDGSMGFGAPIQIDLNGPEHTVLRELADEVVTDITSVDGVRNPQSSASQGIPQISIEVDKEIAALHGLTQDQIIGQIQLQFTGQTVSLYREAGKEMNVTLLYPEEERSTIGDLEDMKIQTPTGTIVPLAELSEFKEVQGAVTLVRSNQQPQMSVSSDIAERDLRSVVKDVEARLDAMNLPEGYSYSIGGEAEDMMKSFSDLAIALVFSVFLVYAVMAVQFENFLYPFIIMFSMPATLIGVIFGHLLFGLSFSIPSFIGIIMLAGIVVNNSIILVDYINILRREGMGRYEAIIEAGRSRLRPILMTTLTTVLAMVPLGLALGEGAELQQPMAITIIFGLTISSIFTLVLIPVIYTFFDELTVKFSRSAK